MPSTHHHTHSHADMYGMARHAKSYDQLTGLLARPLYRRVAADVTTAQLPAGAVVLDVGTGPGRVPRMIAATCPGLQLEGVDLSAQMIQHAQYSSQRELGCGAKRVRFQVADVADLPFPSNSVDLVVSSLSLHHWADPMTGLREVARVLRPGGQGWIYDFRRTLGESPQLMRNLDVDIQVESPLVGAFRFHPIGRLVLRRDSNERH